jgi:outer membrane lipoprotein-sorting protein
MDGRMHNVVVYQRDFRNVQGLMIPFVLETAVEGYRETHKVNIEKVEVNPKLADSLFTKPQSK